MSTFRTTREIPASPPQVFAAISDPARLARWWGPAGFTNTFAECDFRPRGHWRFTMRGPDGTNYPNENVFAKIEPDQYVFIAHISEPKFMLFIGLEPTAAGTLVTWSQKFENVKTAERIEHIVVPANEQNLDRLTAEVQRGSEA